MGKDEQEKRLEDANASDMTQDGLDKSQEEKLGRLEAMVLRLTESLERVQFFDYVEHLNKPRRILWNGFMSGIARGLGMAIGFAVLGAFMMALLTWLANANLPVIGKFVADIVDMVNMYRSP
ncbi:DUF5665 domain-containing protein [Eubacteriales bacterium OttesenSCG-928-M02]|nr:DUF5665 domain-containing protein [Eubacteriales bacterium OttesenSCG-928-M02]